MNYKTIRFISLEEVTEHPLKPVTIMVNSIHNIWEYKCILFQNFFFF